MKIKDIVRTVVTETNSYWPFSGLNKLPYYLAIKAFIQHCKKFPEIKSVSRRSKKIFITVFHDLEPGNGRLGGKIDENIIYKMLEIQRKYRMKATYNIVGKVCENAPNLIKEIHKRGHELANHTYNHDIPTLVTKKSLEESISKCEQVIKELTGVKIEGFRSPESKWNQDLLRILGEKGYVWNAEADRSDQPYYITERLIRLPITMDDWEYESKGLSEKAMYNKLKSTLQRGIRKGKYMAFGFHPWIYALKRERLKVFEEFMSFLANLDKISVVTFGRAANLFGEGLKQGAY